MLFIEETQSGYCEADWTQVFYLVTRILSNDVKFETFIVEAVVENLK